MSYRLVVGLGNSGEAYRETRHNVGFRVIDLLAAETKECFRYDDRGPVAKVRAAEVVYLKPLTFMNSVGPAVRSWSEWLKSPADELMVVADDVSLPLGQLRFRENGSHGGHNGLRSIEESMGTTCYARLKCGIGPVPAGESLQKFVLGRFAENERRDVEEMIAAAARAFRCCQQQGIAVAMQIFNTKRQ